jgi:hypothetical protein
MPSLSAVTRISHRVINALHLRYQFLSELWVGEDEQKPLTRLTLTF